MCMKRIAHSYLNQFGVEVFVACVHLITSNMPFVFCHIQVLHAERGKCNNVTGCISYYDEAPKMFITKCRPRVQYRIYIFINFCIWTEGEYSYIHAKYSTLSFSRVWSGRWRNVDIRETLLFSYLCMAVESQTGTLNYKWPDIAQWSVFRNVLHLQMLDCRRSWLAILYSLRSDHIWRCNCGSLITWKLHHGCTYEPIHLSWISADHIKFLIKRMTWWLRSDFELFILNSWMEDYIVFSSISSCASLFLSLCVYL